jgi:hypothetical protein
LEGTIDDNGRNQPVSRYRKYNKQNLLQTTQKKRINRLTSGNQYNQNKLLLTIQKSRLDPGVNEEMITLVTVEVAAKNYCDGSSCDKFKMLFVTGINDIESNQSKISKPQRLVRSSTT